MLLNSNKSQNWGKISNDLCAFELQYMCILCTYIVIIYWNRWTVVHIIFSLSSYFPIWMARLQTSGVTNVVDDHVRATGRNATHRRRAHKSFNLNTNKTESARIHLHLVGLLSDYIYVWLNHYKGQFHAI